MRLPGAAAVGSGGRGWPSGTMVTFLRTTGVSGLSLLSRDACDGLDDQHAGVASHWPKMVWLPLRCGVGDLGDEELGAVGVGAGVGHGQAAGHVEGEVGIELVLERVAGVAGAGAERDRRPGS